MAWKPQYKRNRFSASSGDVALVAAGYAFTIQKPATGGKRIYLESATVYSSADATVSQAFNGTAATATAGTANTVPPNVTEAATAKVWGASNAGAGTAAGGILRIPAGGSASIDLSGVMLNGAGTAANYTIAIASVTGTVNITFFWQEA